MPSLLAIMMMVHSEGLIEELLMMPMIGWACCCLLLGHPEGEWRDYRGPTGQGSAPTASALPTEWSETKNVRWRTPIPGFGWSTPVVADGVIWLTTATDEGHSLRAVALSFESGEILHDIEVFAPEEPVRLNAKNSHASPSPVHDGDHVYVHFGTMGTASLDARSGSIIWKSNEHVCDHKEGPGSSPILWNGLLIFNADGMDTQHVVALDASTGQTVWKTGRPQPIHPNPDLCKAYATPLVVETESGPLLVSPGAQRAVAYDPATGKERWRVDYEGYSNVPRPISGPGLVYICTGFMKPQLLAIRPNGKGNITETEVVWQFERQVPANPSPILVDGVIYMTSDRGVMSAVDAQSGESLWTGRLGGDYSASPMFGDGKLYFASESGTTTVVEPGPEFKKIATNDIDGRIMASPVPVGRSLLLRTEKALYRIEEN